MSNCRSCHAEIIWAKTESGKAMPLDAKPEKRFILFPGPDGNEDEAVAVDTYVSHFATCPNANQHRKKGG